MIDSDMNDSGFVYLELTNFERFLKSRGFPEAFYKAKEDETSRESNLRALDQDDSRTSYWHHNKGPGYLKGIAEEAKKNGKNVDYTQGLADARCLVKAATGSMFLMNPNGKNLAKMSELNAEKLEEFEDEYHGLIGIFTTDDKKSQTREINFLFSDTTGKDCGLAISFNELAKDFFSVCYIRDPLGENTVFAFTSSGNKDGNELVTPSLEFLVGDDYKPENLIPRKNFKPMIVGIEGMPEHVRKLCDLVIQEDGQLNTEFIKSSYNNRSGEMGRFHSGENNEHMTFKIVNIGEELNNLKEKLADLQKRGEHEAFRDLAGCFTGLNKAFTALENSEWSTDDIQTFLKTSSNYVEIAEQSELKNPRGLGKILDGFLAALETISNLIPGNPMQNKIKQWRKKETDSIAKVGLFKKKIEMLKDMQNPTPKKNADQEEESIGNGSSPTGSS